MTRCPETARPPTDGPCWQERVHHNLLLRHNKVSCTIFHKSDTTLLLGHSFVALNHFLSQTLNHFFLSFIFPSSPVNIIPLPHLVPGSLSAQLYLSFLPFFSPNQTHSLPSLILPPPPPPFIPPLTHYMLTWAAHSLIPSHPPTPTPPAPSVLLSPASFIHPCHFVFGFLLFPSASNTDASSSLHSSSRPSVILTRSSLPLLILSSLSFYSFFCFSSSCPSPSPLPLLSHLLYLSPLHLLIFLSSSLPSYISLNVSLSLSFFPFTLSDGSIDSFCDDIAQGQLRGRKPL